MTHYRTVRTPGRWPPDGRDQNEIGADDDFEISGCDPDEYEDDPDED